MTAGFLVRQAAASDMDAILAVQRAAFPDFQEERAVFVERLVLFPQGFFVATLDEVVCGYAVSHPWPRGSIPALNGLIGALPEKMENYYIHDVSLLPSMRGQGASGLLIAALKARAARQGFSTMALTAVGGSSVFWARHGFVVAGDADLTSKLAPYGDDAVYMEAKL